jgi:hypothetical protein
LCSALATLDATPTEQIRLVDINTSWLLLRPASSLRKILKRRWPTLGLLIPKQRFDLPTGRTMQQPRKLGMWQHIAGLLRDKYLWSLFTNQMCLAKLRLSTFG